jgi:putative solute:sodium symporter small subunit
MQMNEKHNSSAYWRRVLLVTFVALSLCLLVTFGVTYYAAQLRFNFFGWPLAFYMGAQGALITYVVIIAVYAFVMNRLDLKYGADEGISGTDS